MDAKKDIAVHKQANRAPLLRSFNSMADSHVESALAHMVVQPLPDGATRGTWNIYRIKLC